MFVVEAVLLHGGQKVPSWMLVFSGTVLVRESTATAGSPCVSKPSYPFTRGVRIVARHHCGMAQGNLGELAASLQCRGTWGVAFVVRG